MPPKDQKLYALELLRGLCAIGVAGYHYTYWGYGYDLQSLAMFGVYVFFILSSLVLMIRYSKVFGEGISPEQAAKFYRNRLARILPLLMLTALAAYLFFQFKYGGQSLAKAALTGTGLFSLQLPGALSNTPGAWSLGIELAFYAVFPMVCMATTKARLSTICWIMIVLLAAQQVAVTALPSSDDPTFWGQYSMHLTFAPFFLAGIMIFRSRRREVAYGWLVSLALFAAICGYTFFLPGDLFRGGIPYVALSAIAVGSVYFAYNTSLPALILPVARTLGNLSYAVYLSHWLVFQIIHHIDNPVFRFAAFAIGVSTMSGAIYRWFERPIRDRIRSPRGGSLPQITSAAE